MKPRLRSLSIMLFLVLIFFIALPISLDSLLGVHISKYLSWLDRGIRIGGTKITLMKLPAASCGVSKRNCAEANPPSL